MLSEGIAGHKRLPGAAQFENRLQIVVYRFRRV